MKKLFISQPMRGKSPDEIMAERNRIVIKAQEALCEAVNPLPSYFETYDPGDLEVENTAVCFLGNAVALLAKADVAAFGKGWEDARGCRIEHQVCLDYGIDIIEIYSD